MNGIIEKLLADRLEKQGFDWIEIKSVSFSKSDKRFDVELALDGEDAPLSASVFYEVDGDRITVTRVETGKRWITEVLQFVLLAKGSSFPLPTGMKGSLIKTLI
jgi:hypothetical protein